MKIIILRVALFLLITCLISILGVSNALGQCGADGMQQCKTKKKSSKSKKTVETQKASSKSKKKRNLKSNQKYSFRVMYRDSSNIRKTAIQIRKVLVEYGFKPEQFLSVSDSSKLYYFERKINNAYLYFDSSIPLDVREEVTKLIQEILPDAHIEVTDFYNNDDYFLIWIL